ncbi:hypothetical protein C0J52_26016 [Blattella germanica]|nr:hypothetical protein C0J52_26016 [Blattella germanica]
MKQYRMEVCRMFIRYSIERHQKAARIPTITIHKTGCIVSSPTSDQRGLDLEIRAGQALIRSLASITLQGKSFTSAIAISKDAINAYLGCLHNRNNPSETEAGSSFRCGSAAIMDVPLCSVPQNNFFDLNCRLNQHFYNL